MSFDSSKPSAVYEENILTSAIIATLVAGAAVGLLFQLTGRIEPVAAVYGFEGTLTGWALLLIHALVAGALFAVLIVPIAGLQEGIIADALSDLGPFASSTLLGGIYGLVLWAFGVALVMPVLIETLDGGSVSIPYVSGMSIVSFVLFGLLLGVLFAVVYQQLETRETSATDPL